MIGSQFPEGQRDRSALGDGIPVDPKNDSLFHAALESSYDSVLITDADLDAPEIVYVNPAFCRMTGYARDEVIGRTPKMLQGPDTDHEMTSALKHALKQGRSFEASTVNYRKNGQAFHIQWRTSPVLNETGETTHYIAIQRDVTDEVHLIERLKRRAEMDGLTRLLTRAAGEEEFAQMLGRAEAEQVEVSVVIMDIDHFKEINDEFGHLVGDRVLRRVARLIDGRIRGGDLGIRWGGEEFVLVLWDTPLDGARRVAESIRSVIESTPFNDGIEVTVSAGAAQWRTGESHLDVLERADRALYAAKGAGRNRILTEGDGE